MNKEESEKFNEQVNELTTKLLGSLNDYDSAVVGLAALLFVDTVTQTLLENELIRREGLQEFAGELMAIGKKLDMNTRPKVEIVGHTGKVISPLN